MIKYLNSSFFGSQAIAKPTNIKFSLEPLAKALFLSLSHTPQMNPVVIYWYFIKNISTMPYMSFFPHWLLSEFETSLQIVVPMCSSFDSPIWGLITIFRLLVLWFFISSWSCLPPLETIATLIGVRLCGVMSSSTFARLCCSKKTKTKLQHFTAKNARFSLMLHVGCSSLSCPPFLRTKSEEKAPIWNMPVSRQRQKKGGRTQGWLRASAQRHHIIFRIHTIGQGKWQCQVTRQWDRSYNRSTEKNLIEKSLDLLTKIKSTQN